MRGSFPIGRVAGIPLRLHLTFLLLPALAAWLTLEATQDVRAALWMASLTLLLFACVVLHELGHCLAARRLGARVQGITLFPIGGVATMANLPEKPLEEAWIAIAGPLVNVVIALVLLPWVGLQAAIDSFSTLPRTAADLPAALLRANLVLVIFNLIPAFPMDGGRVLRATLAFWMPYATATSVAARIGRFAAILFIVAGSRFSPMLAVVGVFVFIAAGRESAVVGSRGRWGGTPVRALMHPAQTVHPDERLGALLERWHGGCAGDFFVVAEDRLVGLLPRGRLAEALRRGDAHKPAASCMVHRFIAVDVDADAGLTLSRLLQTKQRLFPVMEHGALVGALDLEALPRERVGRAPVLRAPGRRSIVLG